MEIVRRKWGQVLLLIGSIAFAVYCIRDFASMARNSHTQALLHDMNRIMEDVSKLPPGIPRGEELLRRVKALDPGLAPVEVKHALQDYTAAMEGSLQAMKAGRDTTPYDAPMAAPKQRLADCFRKFLMNCLLHSLKDSGLVLLSGRD